VVQEGGRVIKELARGLLFPEGPIALDDGSVLVVEIEGGSLARVAADGTVSRVDCGGGPNGAAVGPDGHVYVCNDGGLSFRTVGDIREPYALAPTNTGGSIQRVDLATGAVETVYTHCGDTPILGGNDIVFDTSGGFYFNATSGDTVYYAQPDGSSIAVAGTASVPNGLGLSPDQDRLYASETYTGQIVYWTVLGPGKLSDTSTVLFSTDGSHHWDGLAIDSHGNVCGADLQQSGITAISPDGDIVTKVTVPVHDQYVTNICFGGPDLRTAFITSSGLGRLYATEWFCPGLPLNFTAS
jgi:gluconolactonase